MNFEVSVYPDDETYKYTSCTPQPSLAAALRMASELLEEDPYTVFDITHRGVIIYTNRNFHV